MSRACQTDAVASDCLTCPLGALHVYFISSSIAEVSPHPDLGTRREGRALTSRPRNSKPLRVKSARAGPCNLGASLEPVDTVSDMCLSRYAA